MNTKSVTVTSDSGYVDLPLRETIIPDPDSQYCWFYVHAICRGILLRRFSRILNDLPIVFSAPDPETIIQMGMKSSDSRFNFIDCQTAVAFVPLFGKTSHRDMMSFAEHIHMSDATQNVLAISEEHLRLWEWFRWKGLLFAHWKEQSGALPSVKLCHSKQESTNQRELPVDLENTEMFKGTLCFSMAYSKSSTDISLDVCKRSLLSDLCTFISKSVRATSEKKVYRHSFGDGVEPGMHCLVLTLPNGGGVYSKRFLYGIAAPIG